MVIEFKGRFQGADRKKLLLVKQQWPDLDLRIVFQKNNPINKGSETKCSDWCNRYGFKWYVGISLPQEWIDELKR